MNLTKKITIALCIIIAFGACKVDDPKPTGSISYQLNGINISTSSLCFGADYGVGIFGTKGNDDLAIFIDTTITEGASYHVGRIAGAVAIEYTNWTNSRHFDSDTGTIVIEHYDGDRITGTFEATVVSGPTTKTITNGKFDVAIDYSNPVTSNYDDSVYAFRKTRAPARINK